MAGRKKLACEFCESDIQDCQEGDLSAGHQLYVEVYPDNTIICISSFANNEMGESEQLQFDINMNYCPVCGRKLGW